ncbi:hypothetical protein [Amycolatopsis silviterrae]|uniref:Uncharacterized protein n=1 Tax=Amycolatopsis silviterrae TaxID=1656914 RepID=A0ABW5H6X6_9PSEU
MAEVTGVGARRDPVASVVSVMVGVVVGLTFLFGFTNVLALALRLGVSVWVAVPRQNLVECADLQSGRFDRNGQISGRVFSASLLDHSPAVRLAGRTRAW